MFIGDACFMRFACRTFALIPQPLTQFVVTVGLISVRRAIPGRYSLRVAARRLAACSRRIGSPESGRPPRNYKAKSDELRLLLSPWRRKRSNLVFGKLVDQLIRVSKCQPQYHAFLISIIL